MGASIHEIFAGQARRTPAAVALRQGDRAVTYADLDAAANGVAARLAAAGVRHGHVVALALPRCTALVAAALGALKCGAAYAALDPGWPPQRLRDLVRRLDSPVVVSRPPWAADLDHSTLAVDDDLTSPAAGAGFAPVPVAGSRAAMLFFTSGSSGAAKAVLAPHQGITRLVVGCDFAELGPTAVIPQAAALPWDAMAFELWGALLTGGTSVLVEAPYLDPSLLRAHVAAHGVNTAWFTASLFNLVVDEDIAAFAGLRTVVTGGERLSMPHVREFARAHPDVRLLNGYGPVESTVFATTHRVTSGDLAAADVPLGRPVNRTRILVLDRHREVGASEVGEICIAGDGLALGYLGDPAETARRFVTVEVDGAPVRVYRTGDLGRIDGDGLLHFVGRADRQVKIRGHRVEPEEIERAITAVPSVARAVVVPLADAHGAWARLAAFYTVRSGGPDEAVLRRALRTRLPAYLVPDRIARVDGFPLTDTGKVDQEALARRAWHSPTTSGGVAPEDALEAAVAEEFAEVIGAPWPDRKASFDLAGTSLDLIRLGSRVARRLGRPVPPSVLAATPTVAGVAAWLRDSPRPVCRVPPADGPVPLRPALYGFWLADQLDPRDVSQHCLMVWRLTAPIEPTALGAALSDVYLRHEALRMRYVLADGPVAVPPERPAPLEFTELEPGPEPVDALRTHLRRPFDLAAGRIIRGAAVMGGGLLLLGLAVHHIAFDGWSEHLFADDLTVAVEAGSAGRAPMFERPAPSFAEVDAAYDEVHGPPPDSHVEFWRAALKGTTPVALPRDPGGVAGTWHCQVAAELVAAAERLGRDVGGHASHVLLASFADAFAAALGLDDLVVGVPVMQRGHPVLDVAVGCLLSMVCVRLRPGGGDLAAQTDACQRALRAATAHQDVPIATVARLAEPPPPVGRPPYSVIFTAHDRPRPSLSLPGGRTGVPLEESQTTSRELIVEVWPRSDGSALCELSFPAGVAAGWIEDIGRAWLTLLSTVAR